jgi:hypothetical protein
LLRETFSHADRGRHATAAKAIRPPAPHPWSATHSRREAHSLGAAHARVLDADGGEAVAAGARPPALDGATAHHAMLAALGPRVLRNVVTYWAAHRRYRLLRRAVHLERQLVLDRPKAG